MARESRRQTFPRLVRWPVRNYLQSRTSDVELTQNLNEGFNKSLVTLCDVQLLTGLALQITIYYLLPSGLSAYHWQMAVLLTWFANVTHQSGLTSLRKYLYLHPHERNLRVIFMALLSAILLDSMVPTFFFNWHNSLDSAIKRYMTTQPDDGRDRPVVEDISKSGLVEVTAANASSAAICYFKIDRAEYLFQQELNWNLFVIHNDSTVLGLASHSVVDKLRDTTAFQSMILSILLLLFGAATRSIKLFKPSSLLFRNSIRNFFSRWTKRIIISGHQRLLRVSWARREIEDREPSDRRKAAVLYLYTRPMVVAMVVGRLYADLYSSMLSEVYWLIISVTWGDLRLATLRKSASVDEDEITAGQFLPILLFAGPILSSVVTLWPGASLIWKSLGPQPRAASPTPDTTTQSLVEPPPEREQSARPSTTDPGIELQVLPTNNRPTSTPQSNRNQEQTPSIHDLLEMDYSQQKWTDSLLVMPCIQILMLTVYILSAVYNTETSAWRVFQTILLWVLWIHPSVIYCYLLLVLGADMEVFMNRIPRSESLISPQVQGVFGWIQRSRFGWWALILVYSVTPSIAPFIFFLLVNKPFTSSSTVLFLAALIPLMVCAIYWLLSIKEILD